MIENELEDDFDDEKEPEVIEEIGNLRLDPEMAKRYREIRKMIEARQKADGLNSFNEQDDDF